MRSLIRIAWHAACSAQPVTHMALHTGCRTQHNLFVAPRALSSNAQYTAYAHLQCMVCNLQCTLLTRVPASWIIPCTRNQSSHSLCQPAPPFFQCCIWHQASSTSSFSTARRTRHIRSLPLSPHAWQHLYRQRGLEVIGHNVYSADHRIDEVVTYAVSSTLYTLYTI